MGGMASGTRAPMTPRSYTSALPSPTRPRSNFGGSYVSGASGFSSKSSRARLFAQREGSALMEDMHTSDREMRWDTSLHLIRRQQPWNSSQQGTQVPWHTHTSYDRLNWNLEPHPPWIAKSPGTYASTFERNLNFAYNQPTLPAGLAFRPPTAEWDSRFLVANTLSNDPVTNGRKKGLNNRRGMTVGNLSPTRSFDDR